MFCETDSLMPSATRNFPGYSFGKQYIKQSTFVFNFLGFFNQKDGWLNLRLAKPFIMIYITGDTCRSPGVTWRADEKELFTKSPGL